MPNISLVIPCYNEEKNIQTGSLDKIAHFVNHDDQINEVIIVDDGSSDDSVKLIKKDYLSEYPKFKLIQNNHGGKAMAVTAGFIEAKGEYVLFTDFDLAVPIEEISKLKSELEKDDLDVVFGSRGSHREGAPLIRKIMAIGMIILRKMIIGLDVKDTQCGFKMFRREVFLKIIKKMKVYGGEIRRKGPSVSAGWDVELLFLSRKMGYKVKEIEVIWRHVDTKRVNFVTDSIEGLRGLISIRINDMKGLYD